MLRQNKHTVLQIYISILISFSVFANVACDSTAVTNSAPNIESVDPETGSTLSEHSIAIRGNGFVAKVARHLSGDKKWKINDRFQVTLFTTTEEGRHLVPLDVVEYVDTETLKAVIPPNILPGKYAMEITDPFGNKDTLVRAYTAYVGLPYSSPIDIDLDWQPILDTDIAIDTEENDTDTEVVDRSIEPRHCSGFLWASEKVAVWSFIEIHLVDCDLACDRTYTLTSKDSGDELEFVIMLESPPCSGHFFSNLTTGNLWPCLGGNLDGCITVENGFTVETTYSDEADRNGQPQTVDAVTDIKSMGNVADLSQSSLTLEDLNGGEIEPLDTLEICIEIDNRNFSQSAIDATVVQRIPEGLTYVSNSIDGCLSKSDQNPGELTWNCGTIGTFDRETVCYMTTVDPLPPGVDSFTINIVATVSSSNAYTEFPRKHIIVQ